MRRVFFIILVLLLAGLLGAGWYGYRKGFTRKWRTYVRNEFHKRGVEISLRQLALEPFRGLVARDVKIYDSRERRRTVAGINEVLLVINYANFFKGLPFIEALDLREARLALPVDPANPRGPAVEVRNLSGRLLLPPKQIYLSRLDADFYGIRVSATGRLINPGAFKNSKAGTRSLAAAAGRLVEELKALRYENEPPRLEVRFSGDLTSLSRVFIEGTLSARRVHRGDWRLGSLSADVSLRDGVVELGRLSASDKRGSFSATGRWTVKTGETALRFRSTLNAPAILSALDLFKPELAELSLEGSPLVDLTLAGRMGEAGSWRGVGHLGLSRFTWRSVPFESLEADASWNAGSWSARDVKLVHRSGSLEGDVMVQPNDFRARLGSTLDPQALAPLLPGGEVWAQFDFVQAPRLEIEARGVAPEWDRCTGSVRLSAGRGSFRNVGAERLAIEGRFGEGRLRLDPVRIERAEGAIDGKVTLDLNRAQAVLEGVEAHVQPAEVMFWFAPNLAPAVAPFRFSKEPPTVRLAGTVDLKHVANTRLAGEVNAPAGMSTTFLKKNVTVEKVSSKLEVAGRRLRFVDAGGEAFGGRLRGEGEVTLDKGRLQREGRLTLENVELAALWRLFFKEEPLRGNVDGVFEWNGSSEDARTLRGRGEVELRDGHFFGVSIFAGAAGLLHNAAPGLMHENTRAARATFTLADGVVSTRDLEVDSANFAVHGSGRLGFADDALDFSLRFNAPGIPGGPVAAGSGHNLELLGDERISKPRWRLKGAARP